LIASIFFLYTGTQPVEQEILHSEILDMVGLPTSGNTITKHALAKLNYLNACLVIIDKIYKIDF
jgi:hypothetical protein